MLVEIFLKIAIDLRWLLALYCRITGRMACIVHYLIKFNLQEKAVVNINIGVGGEEQVSDNSCVLNSADMKGMLDWFGDITYQKSIAKDDEVEVSVTTLWKYLNTTTVKDKMGTSCKFNAVSPIERLVSRWTSLSHGLTQSKIKSLPLK